MAITYEHLRPYLHATEIKLRDRFNTPLTEQEAKRRLVDSIQASKVRPDVLVIVIK